MTRPNFRPWAVALLAGALACLPAAAQPRPAETREEAELRTLRAEIKLLKTQTTRQKGEIAALKKKLADAAADDEAPAPAKAAARKPQRVVFVIDMSGSMIDKISAVNAEVVKGVAALAPGTSFNVILAAEDKAEPYLSRPVLASPEAAAELHAYLNDFVTSGTSNMTPAVDLALRQQRADVVWFITDGDMPNNDEFVKRVRAGNRGRRARINAVAATTSGDSETSASFVRLLCTVTAEHGGKCFDMTGAVIDLASLPPPPPPPPSRRVGGPLAQQPPPKRAVGTRPPPPPGRGSAPQKPKRPADFDPNNVPTGPSIFQECAPRCRARRHPASWPAEFEISANAWR